MSILDNIAGEFKSRNFSIYGQWTGILAMILCIALGIANLFSRAIVFSAFCLVFGALLIFVEIPILLRICPTSKQFDDFVKKFHHNWGRAGLYIGMGIVQWLSIIVEPTSLIAAAVVLTIAGLFYTLAAIKGQEFTGSKTLGGSGVASMII
ncbi:golgi apparatus membrane protein TVP18 [Terfezia claveryi]|nr:golgi apparatus membrane protein TVP18 [Terfezia claveryi]